MELLVRHPPALHELAVQRADLHPAHHVRGLIERRVGAVERPPHLRLRVRALMSDARHQQVDRFLRRHCAQVETE